MKHYAVVLSKNDKAKFKEAFKWCSENLAASSSGSNPSWGTTWWTLPAEDNTISFCFENADDATLFKLKFYEPL